MEEILIPELDEVGSLSEALARALEALPEGDDWKGIIPNIRKHGLSDEEARLLIGLYFDFQRLRVATKNRTAKLMGGVRTDVVEATLRGIRRLEAKVTAVLSAYAASTPWGQWALKVEGIGPMIAAALCAYVNPERFATVGKVWRYSGLDPTVKWEKGKPRPYSPRMKQIAYYIGESFIRQPGSYYHTLFKGRKEYEWRKNLRGELGQQAMAMLPRATEYQRYWIEGLVDPEYAAAVARGEASSEKPKLLKRGESGFSMLPPIVIHARARRWVAKLFLAHFWEVRYWYQTGERPPKPYAIAHLGHVDYIPPYNPPWEEPKAR